MIDRIDRWIDAMPLKWDDQTFRFACTFTHISHLIYMPKCAPLPSSPPINQCINLVPYIYVRVLHLPLHINLTLNLHLNRPRLRIRRRLKRTHRILQIKPMRHQLLQLHNPTLYQSYSPRPRIGISVLELQIDFLC